jgi:tetratricopeptide (TPR) repeat protein
MPNQSSTHLPLRDRESLLARIARRRMRLEPREQTQLFLHVWLQGSPQSPAAHALSGLLDMSSGQAEEGRRKIEQAAHTGDACALWALAQVHLSDGAVSSDRLAARACLERAVLRDPYDGDCWIALAQMDAADGDWVVAARAAARACEIDPHSALPYMFAAEIALRRNDFQGAAQACADALARDPQSAGAYEIDAQVRARAGDLKSACEQLDVAMLLKPASAETLLQSAHWLLLLGDAARLQSALTRARRAAAMAPLEWRALLLQSQILQAQGRHRDAANCLGSAVHAQPQVVELWLGLAVASMLVGDIEKVDSSMAQALVLSPGTSAVIALVTEVNLRLGRWTSAFATPTLGGNDVAAGSTLRLSPKTTLDFLTMSRWCAKAQSQGLNIALHVRSADAEFARRIPGVTSVSDTIDPALAISGIELLPGILRLESPEESSTTAWLTSSSPVQATWRQDLGHLPRPWLMVDLGPTPDVRLVELLTQDLRAREGSIVLVNAVPAWEQSEHSLLLHRISLDTIEDAAACLSICDAHWLVDGEIAALAGGLGLGAKVYVKLTHHPYWAGTAERTPWYPSLTVVREGVDGWLPRLTIDGSSF